MKLSDLYEGMAADLKLTLVQKKLANGDSVELDMMQHSRDHSIWHFGHLESIQRDKTSFVFGSPAEPSYLATILINQNDRPEPKKIRISQVKFDQMHFYKVRGGWKLSDRPNPKDDDEAE